MKLKTTPEDFVVEEIPIEFSGSGPYSIVRVEKRMCNTEYAARTLARYYGVDRKAVGFAGMKDKVACTIQYMSVRGGRPRKFSDERITATPFTHHKSPLSLGDLLGNKFVIVARDLETPLVKKTSVRNYFGAQRFGGSNIAVGHALIKKDFFKVCELLHLGGWEVSNPLEHIKEIPKHTLLLYVHAYQSYLWNKVLESLDKPPKTLPLVGFGTDLSKEPKKVREAYEKIMTEEEVGVRDFIIKQLPNLSSEGDVRETTLKIKDLQLEAYEEGVQTVTFTLPKGAYATVVMQELCQ